MANIRRTLSADGDDSVVIVNGYGEYLYCYDQDGLVEVTLDDNDGNSETHIVERFVTLPNRSFQRITIKNISGLENSIQFFTGKGEYIPSQDRATVAVDVAGETLPVSVQGIPVVTLDAGALALTVNSFDVATGANVLNDIAVPPNTLVTIFPASADRVEAIIQSRDDNTTDVRIAPHAMASSQSGEVLKPEGSASYRTLTEITAFNDSDQVVFLSRNELTRGAV